MVDGRGGEELKYKGCENKRCRHSPEMRLRPCASWAQIYLVFAGEGEIIISGRGGGKDLVGERNQTISYSTFQW